MRDVGKKCFPGVRSRRMRRFLVPKYWPFWLLIGCLRCAAFLPYRGVMAIGAALGLVLRADAFKRYIVLTNLKRCFPMLNRSEIEALAREHYRSVGKGLVEMAITWWWRLRRLDALGRVSGLEHLQDALRDEKGVVLLAAHVTSLEICTYYLVREFPLDVTYKLEAQKKFLSAYIQTMRTQGVRRLIPSDDLRGMLASLRSNHVVWYAPDQDFGRRGDVFAPFFGIQTSGVSALSRICAKSGAKVVPFYARRLAGDSGYELVILPALENFPGKDPVEDATRINGFYEAAIHRAPEQYLWFHRRFRTRPPGEPRFYLSKREFRTLSREERRALLDRLLGDTGGV